MPRKTRMRNTSSITVTVYTETMMQSEAFTVPTSSAIRILSHTTFMKKVTWKKINISLTPSIQI